MRRWPYTFAVVVAVAITVAAVASSWWLGLPLKDPEGFLGPAYVRLPLLAFLFFAAGIVPSAIKRAGIKKLPSGVVLAVKEEWSFKRVGYIATGLITFYACYVSYRNLKSYLPVYRDNILFDRELLDFDYWLAFGNHPALVMHEWLGTDLTAHVLSFAYIAYLPLIPITLGAFLVLNRDLSIGAWYATALGLNWVLGTLSYYALPTVGPAFQQPQLFTELSTTDVTALQQSLFRNRVDVLTDPWASERIHGVAGFASLHTSVTFTAALFMERTGQRLVLRIAAWVFFLLTLAATVYFGWHYIADLIGGVAIGWLSVSLGAWASGNRGRRRRWLRRRSSDRPASLMENTSDAGAAPNPGSSPA
ncbi:phosphatase PAP2 family protein [Aeromicrobium sp. CTD01-1L150]|uniref:phosphatase PAP2 family protein n=1 Tax=Aeromicrobium sp. CTD01-1L150 TaxID=3341830 RepID=UPI0035BF5CAD